MKKHGPNSENISQAVLRLGTKQWRLRAPLTFLHATSGIEPQTLLPESSALPTRPPRQPLKFETMLGRHHYSSGGGLVVRFVLETCETRRMQNSSFLGDPIEILGDEKKGKLFVDFPSPKGN